MRVICSRARRRVHPLSVSGGSTLLGNNWKKKRRRGPGQVHRRLCPSTNQTTLRGRNTLSVHARVAAPHTARPHPSEGVTHHQKPHDPALLIAHAAQNRAVSDRAFRVYTVAVAHGREVDAATIAAALPSLTEAQASRLLGDLVTAGLLVKRLKTIGYKPGGLRRRAGAYRLAGGAA